MRKKYLGLSALAAIMLLPLLLMVLLQTTQQWLRHSREERYATRQMITVAVKAATVVWEENGRELRIGDRFFDVTSVERQGDRLLLRGYYDDAETAVWQLLQHAWKHHGMQGYKLLLLLQCLIPLYFLCFAFCCRYLLPSWHKWPKVTLPLPPSYPPFCPPRKTDLAFS